MFQKVVSNILDKYYIEYGIPIEKENLGYSNYSIDKVACHTWLMILKPFGFTNISDLDKSIITEFFITRA